MIFRKLCSVLAIVFFVLPSTAMAGKHDKSLFINLTSDQTNRAAMAIAMGSKALAEEKIPVTIYLTVDGVRVADTSIPEQKYVNGKSPRTMLKDFMANGGQVIICGMCMTNVGGMDKDEVVPGVKFSGGLSALLKPGAASITF